MDIRQLSVTFSEEQDRLLVRINTQASEELRLWLTRRLTLSMEPVLQQLVKEHVTPFEAAQPVEVEVQAHPAPPSQTDSTSAPAPTAAAGPARSAAAPATTGAAAALRKTDFATPFAETPASLPLGAEPLLVTEVNMAAAPEGRLTLGFSEKLSTQTGKPRAFQMTLAPDLVHGLLHLMGQALAKAQWHDNAVLPAQTSTRLPSSEHAMLLEAERPKYLN